MTQYEEELRQLSIRKYPVLNSDCARRKAKKGFLQTVYYRKMHDLVSNAIDKPAMIKELKDNLIIVMNVE